MPFSGAPSSAAASASVRRVLRTDVSSGDRSMKTAHTNSAFVRRRHEEDTEADVPRVSLFGSDTPGLTPIQGVNGREHRDGKIEKNTGISSCIDSCEHSVLISATDEDKAALQATMFDPSQVSPDTAAAIAAAICEDDPYMRFGGTRNSPDSNSLNYNVFAKLVYFASFLHKHAYYK